MFDIVTIGSALIDVYIHSDEFAVEQRQEGIYLCQPFHDKIPVDRFELLVGGGAANTAVACARLGLQVGIIAELGQDDASTIVTSHLQRNSVNTSLLIHEKKEQTGGSVILVGPGGGRTVLVSRAAAAMLDPHDIPSERLKRVEWIHLSSIGGKVATLQQIFASVTQQRLSWNPGKSELLLLANHTLRLETIPCSIFSVNEEEWRMLDHLQSEIIKHIPEIIITNGSQGGTLYVQEKKRTYMAQSLQAIDETGAGDAFVSTYVAARYLDQPPLRALQWAKQNAASVVGQRGAQAGLLSKATLARRQKMS